MQDEDSSSDNLQLITKQFLCNVPINEIDWKLFSNLTLEVQKRIINNTVRSHLVLKYPIRIDYQKKFVKSLLEYLEKQESVIDDSLYEEYGRLVALPPGNRSFKHYNIEKGNRNIILEENSNLICEGTTGLRTWQASLALSEWILCNSSYFQHKNVLELGSGIGLTGLIISLFCGPNNVYLTDCHFSVLRQLSDNVSLNIGTEMDTKSSSDEFLLRKTVNGCCVSVVRLDWDNINEEFCQKFGQIDKIVAADVVYDKSIFGALLSAVDSLFTYCSVQEFILSCTERNTQTLSDFISLLGVNYLIAEQNVPKPKNFLWPRSPPVRLFKITARGP